MLPSASTICCCALVLVLLATGLRAQQTLDKHTEHQNSPRTPSLGQRAFASRCAGCHGLDGRGGERAPNIASNPQVQRLSDLQLQRIVANGRPDFGMPAFRLMGLSEVKRVVEYLRTLQGGDGAAPIRGDPTTGRLLFIGKAACSSCHRVRDEGAFFGPDLSSYANGLPAKEIRRAITGPDPSSARDPLAVARTRSGEKFTGAIRNEDNFSLQLQTADGIFHFVMKADLESLEYQSQATMPTDYGERLSPQELDDLVSYLHSLKAVEMCLPPARISRDLAAASFFAFPGAVLCQSAPIEPNDCSPRH
jgi:cytochrome c oxidase cbb3-type subunit III